MTETVTKTIRKGYQNHCQRVLKRSEKGIKPLPKRIRSEMGIKTADF